MHFLTLTADMKLPTVFNKISIVLACEFELEKCVCDMFFFLQINAV